MAGDLDDDVVVPQQDSIRIYANQRGSITIEQSDTTGNETAFVIFTEQHAESVCAAIMEVAKRIRGG